MKGGHENLFKNLPPPFPPRAVPLPLFGCAGRSTREVKWLLFLLLLPPLGASSKERSRKYDLFPAHLGKLHLVLYVLFQLRVLFSQSSLMSSFNADFFKNSGVLSDAIFFCCFSLIEEAPFPAVTSDQKNTGRQTRGGRDIRRRTVRDWWWRAGLGVGHRMDGIDNLWENRPSMGPSGSLLPAPPSLRRPEGKSKKRKHPLPPSYNTFSLSLSLPILAPPLHVLFPSLIREGTEYLMRKLRKGKK